MKRKSKLLSVFLLAMFCLAFLVAPAFAGGSSNAGHGGTIGLLLGVVSLVGLAFAVQPGVRDASLKTTTALPNGAATVYSTGIDTNVTTSGVHLGEYEWLLSAPAMNSTEMPNSKTMTYSILVDTVNPIDGSSTVLMPSVIVQTGAGGAGCAAATHRFRLPSSASRIVGVRAVGSASGDATTASFTLEPLF